MSTKPQSVRVIRAFISSPGDLAEERKLLKKVCLDITRDIGDLHQFRLEPVMWETDAHSGKADRSQQVIMNSIGAYDIYVGLMGFYFGSDTGKFLSGTEEEFQDALARFHKSETVSAHTLQFYFSSALVDIAEVDLAQYQRVQDFQEAVGQEGVFYKKFENLSSLEALVRPALIKAATDIATGEGEEGLHQDILSAPEYSQLRPYDRLRNLNGLFRRNKSVTVQILTQDAMKHLGAVTSTTEQITSKLGAFTKSMVVATREAKVVQTNPKKRQYFLKKVDEVFEKMEEYYSSFSVQVEVLNSELTKSLSLLQRATTIQKEISEDWYSDVQPITNGIAMLKSAYADTIAATKKYNEEIPLIPELGERWAVNAAIVEAVNLDFIDFLQAAISTMDRILEEIGT